MLFRDIKRFVLLRTLTHAQAHLHQHWCLGCLDSSD